MGLLVDRAADVVELDDGLLEAPPANVKGADGRFFRGVGRANGHLVAVLDAKETLAQ